MKTAAWLVFLCFMTLFWGSRTREKAQSAWELCTSSGMLKSPTYQWFRGDVMESLPERASLSQLRAWKNGSWVRLAGQAVVFFEVGSLSEGEEVQVLARWGCRLNSRNPSTYQDGFQWFETPRWFSRGQVVVVRLAPKSFLWRHYFVQTLNNPFRDYPVLQGWIRAVWMGDFKGLPIFLRDFYRETGCLALLALSGQHVMILSSILGGALRILLSVFGMRWWYFRWHLGWILSLLAATVLLITSQGAGSMVRTWVMVVVAFVLRLRRLETSAVQMALSAVAVTLFVHPSLFFERAFLLSAVSTYFVAYSLSCRQGQSKWVRILWMSFSIPLFLSPLLSLLFGKISWNTGFWSAVLSPIWTLVVIPVCFALPLLFLALPQQYEPILANALSLAAEKFEKLHLLVNPQGSWVIRLTWLEVFMLTWLLLGAASWYQNCRKKDALQ